MDIVALLAEMDAAEEFEDAIRETVQAVQSEGRPGKVVLTLTVKPNGEKGVKLGATAVPKLPTPSPEERFFYVDRDGNPCREKPNQPSLFAPKLVSGGNAAD